MQSEPEAEAVAVEEVAAEAVVTEAVAAEAAGTQLAQGGARSEVAALAGSFGFATGYFGEDVRTPTGEASDIVALVHEMVGP